MVLRLNYLRFNAYIHDLIEIGGTTSYVRGARLDSLVEDEQRMDVIKVDIAGYGRVALEGTARLVQWHRPLIVSGFHLKA